MYMRLMIIDTKCECKRGPAHPVYDPKHKEFYCSNCQRPLTTVTVEKKGSFYRDKYDLRNALKKFDEKADGYERTIDEYLERISEMEGQIDSYKETVTSRDEEIKELRQSNEELQNALDNQKGFFNRFSKESNRGIKKLNEKLTGAEKDLESLQQR